MFVSGWTCLCSISIDYKMAHKRWFNSGISSSKHCFFLSVHYIGRFWTKSLQNKPRFVWGVLMRPGKAFLDFIAEEACLPWKLWIHEGRLDSGGWYTRTTGSIKSIQMKVEVCFKSVGAGELFRIFAKFRMVSSCNVCVCEDTYIIHFIIHTYIWIYIYTYIYIHIYIYHYISVFTYIICLCSIYIYNTCMFINISGIYDYRCAPLTLANKQNNQRVSINVFVACVVLPKVSLPLMPTAPGIVAAEPAVFLMSAGTVDFRRYRYVPWDVLVVKGLKRDAGWRRWHVLSNQILLKSQDYIPSLKLTYPLKIDPWKTMKKKLGAIC